MDGRCGFRLSGRLNIGRLLRADVLRAIEAVTAADEANSLTVVAPTGFGRQTCSLLCRSKEARVTAENRPGKLQGAAAFSGEARWVAFMLVAHARRCDGCFGASRIQLTSLGFDEPALDGFCANPAVLPLPERERAFVKYVLRIATDPSELQPKDFHEMQAQGLSADDVRDIAGFAAWAVMNTIFTTVANTGLQED